MHNTDEATKKTVAKEPERELVVYGPFHNTFFNILRSFRSKYPEYDINMTYYGNHPGPTINKIEQEVKNGIQTADIVIHPHYAILHLKEMGLLKRYHSDLIDVYPSQFKDEDDRWAGIAIEPTRAVYNPNLIGTDEVPSSWTDLTDPKLKGRVAMQSVVDRADGLYSFYYFAALLNILGERKWERIMKDYVNNVKPKSFPCYHNLHKYIARGDYGIGLPLPLIKVGWSVNTLNIRDVPNLAMQRSIAILENAEHPVAAELFYNYLLSEDWQRKMGTEYEGLIPAKPNTKMKYGAQVPVDGITFFPTEEDVRKIGVYTEKFQQVGLP
jgi:iron(III) transport system substrate-binding protein